MFCFVVNHCIILFSKQPGRLCPELFLDQKIVGGTAGHSTPLSAPSWTSGGALALRAWVQGTHGSQSARRVALGPSSDGWRRLKVEFAANICLMYGISVGKTTWPHDSRLRSSI